MPLNLKPFLTLVLCSTLTISAFSQNAPKRFEISYGGSSTEIFRDGVQLTNGNYVAAGGTTSTDGDIQDSYGNGDFLLTCTSPTGQKLWVKTIGGTDGEAPGWEGSHESVSATVDGGFYFSGTTTSNNGEISGNHGAQDIFVARFDASGNTLWKKCLGGNMSELAADIATTPDGGCIVIGSASSNNNGDVPAHSSNVNTSDIWIVKLNNLGEIEWSKTFGGSKTDRGFSIEATQDGGYIFTANISSSDGHTAPSFIANQFGDNDIWVVKLTSSGEINWQKRFGGSADDNAAVVMQAINGDFYVWCSTRSTNGDFSPNAGLYDFALVRMNSDGTVVFKKTYGGSAWDSHGNIVQTADGDLIALGGSYSFYINGIRTYKVVEPSSLLLRISAEDGTLKRVTSISDMSKQSFARVIVTRDNELVSFGSIDAAGGSNREALISCFANNNVIKGFVYNDINGNGVKDVSEPTIDGVTVESIKPGIFATNTKTVNGIYNNETDSGRIVTSIKMNKSGYFTVKPDSLVTLFDDFNQVTGQDFGLKFTPNISDLKIVIIPLSENRAGRKAIYRVVVYNIGTETVPAGRIRFIKDRRTGFVSSSFAGIYSADTLDMPLSNFKVFDTLQIQIVVLNDIPPKIRGGDWLIHKAIVEPITGDADPEDNTFRLRHLVTGPLDPNDKLESHGNNYSTNAGLTLEPLNYTIRFQNVGTDTAFRVVIRDTLDPKLDPSTLTVLATSFPSQLKIEKNICTWIFKDINLPDSNRNESASHGFLSFTIRPKAVLTVGDSLANSASIYFDFEYPVKTNTWVTTVSPPLQRPPVPEMIAANTTLCISDETQTFKIKNKPAAELEAFTTVTLNGHPLTVREDSTFQLDPMSLSPGAHQLKIKYENESGIEELLLQINIKATDVPEVDLVSSKVNVSPTDPTIDLTALPLSGQGTNPNYVIAKDQDFLEIIKTNGPASNISIPVTSLKTGKNMFFVRMESNSQCVSSPFAIDSVSVFKLEKPENSNHEFMISPNPFGDEMQIKTALPDIPVTIVIHNTSGKMIYQGRFINQPVIRIRNIFEHGLYLVSFYSEKGRLITVTKAYRK